MNFHAVHPRDTASALSRFSHFFCSSGVIPASNSCSFSSADLGGWSKRSKYARMAPDMACSNTGADVAGRVTGKSSWMYFDVRYHVTFPHAVQAPVPKVSKISLGTLQYLGVGWVRKQFVFHAEHIHVSPHCLQTGSWRTWQFYLQLTMVKKVETAQQVTNRTENTFYKVCCSWKKWTVAPNFTCLRTQ